MNDTRRKKAELIEELRDLRSRVADLETGARRERSADESLRRMEARFFHVLANANALVIELDEQGTVTYASPSAADVFGLQPEEILHKNCFEWLHGEDLDEALDVHRRMLTSGHTERGIYRAQHKAGHWMWVETIGSPYRTASGETYTVVLTRDVTQLKNADDALRESEARYRSLAENASDLIAEIDDQGRILFLTPNSSSILGHGAEELIGRTLVGSVISENTHPDDRESVLHAFRSAAEGTDSQVEYRYRHPDGGWRRFDCKGRAYRTADGARHYVVISRDVTLRVEAEQALRHSEERYRVLAETTHNLVVELDAQGSVVFISPNCSELIGFEPEEVVGADPFQFLHPDDLERVVERYRQRLKTRRPVAREPFRARHRDGSWRWFEAGGFVYRSEGGEMHLVGVARDITEVHHAEEERRKLEESMQQAQKLESLGALAGGIAHDFNNLLTPILGNTSLALMDLPEESPVRGRLDKVQKAARRAAVLTGQMLAYTGQEALQIEALDLSRLVREMETLLGSAVSKKAALVYELSRDLPLVEADARQLSQVVLNLITNASEALGDTSGQITVRTGTVEVDGGSLSRGTVGEELSAGRYVSLEVADTGCGMGDDTRVRIFDPFFSTKFTGRGLGLAAVLGIVRGHRGAIEMESEPGRGTSFRVLLPPAERATARAAGQPFESRSWRGAGRVLVADDDEGVRELAEETLSRCGLTVLCAADGREAVELFRKHADEIEMVLLDQTMPSISGEEAFDAIRAIRGDARIILVSGYSQANLAERMAGRDLAGFLQKPFLPETLMEKVQDLLGN
jgi:PAS domain S-box-containing protein